MIRKELSRSLVSGVLAGLLVGVYPIQCRAQQSSAGSEISLGVCLPMVGESNDEWPQLVFGMLSLRGSARKVQLELNGYFFAFPPAPAGLVTANAVFNMNSSRSVNPYFVVGGGVGVPFIYLIVLDAGAGLRMSLSRTSALLLDYRLLVLPLFSERHMPAVSSVNIRLSFRL